MMLNNILELFKKNMHLFILAIYGYVLLQIESNDYITMILLTVAACLAICYIKKQPNTLKLPILENYDNPKCGSRLENMTNMEKKTIPEKTKEGFENPPKIMNQLPDVMGPYDGLCLQTGNREKWMKTPDETALVPDDAIFTYLSSQGPVKPVFSDNSSLTGPPIDGHPDSDKKMFMLANNRTSPNCCPSTFSTSTGCVCTTKNQRDYIASRGVSKKANLEDI